MSRSEEPAEAVVLTASVSQLLWDRMACGTPRDASTARRVSVGQIAEASELSERTVYRVLSLDYGPTMKLSTADRLLLAAGSHLCFAEVIDPEDQ